MSGFSRSEAYDLLSMLPDGSSGSPRRDIVSQFVRKNRNVATPEGKTAKVVRAHDMIMQKFDGGERNRMIERLVDHFGPPRHHTTVSAPAATNHATSTSIAKIIAPPIYPPPLIRTHPNVPSLPTGPPPMMTAWHVPPTIASFSSPHYSGGNVPRSGCDPPSRAPHSAGPVPVGLQVAGPVPPPSGGPVPVLAPRPVPSHVHQSGTDGKFRGKWANAETTTHVIPEKFQSPSCPENLQVDLFIHNSFEFYNTYKSKDGTIEWHGRQCKVKNCACLVRLR